MTNTTLITVLRLADDTTRPIVIEQISGCEWEAVTIDGIPAHHWLDESGLQCGKGEIVNAQAKRAYRWKQFTGAQNED